MTLNQPMDNVKSVYSISANLLLIVVLLTKYPFFRELLPEFIFAFLIHCHQILLPSLADFFQ